MKHNLKQLAVFAMCSVLLAGCGEKEQMVSDVVVEDTGDKEDKENTEEIEETENTENTDVFDDQWTDESPTVDVETETAVDISNTDIEVGMEQISPQISVIMVGDMLLHTPVENSAKQEDGSYDFGAIFEHTKEKIQSADLALVNQEVIIGGEELGISGYPAFNAPYAVGDALVETGFDVICHGTNHALDKGKKGLLNCLEFWEETYPDIAVLGIHDSAETQDELYIYEKDGVKIAILNYTYGTNGIAMPSDMPFAVDMLEETAVVEDIRRAEEQADFTIVCPHWGTEYELGISASQEKWTQIFLKNGVDLVLGTHPHVIEPIEWVIDEESGQKMLVYYSLGNFVNWTSGSGEGIANRMVGGMAQITISRAESGEVYIETYDVEPLVAHLEEGMNGVTVYPLSEYTDELASANQIIKQDPDFSLQYCEALCEKVWGEEIFYESGCNR